MLFSRSFAKKTLYMCSTKQWMTSKAEAGGWPSNASVRGSSLRLRVECAACSPPKAGGIVKMETAETPGKPLTIDLRGLAASVSDRPQSRPGEQSQQLR
jgi:hypothetical protein